MKLIMEIEYRSNRKPKKDESAYYDEVILVALSFAPKMFEELWVARDDAASSTKTIQSARYSITYTIKK